MPVYHFHQAQLSLSSIANPGPISMPVASGRLVVALGEQSGDLWLTSPP